LHFLLRAARHKPNRIGPIKETPVYGDPHIQKIVTMQTGFAWQGLCDKQITNISDFRVVVR
jgi:hypothetical protein